MSESIDLSSPELAAELQQQLGGTQEEISELLKNVTETVLEVPSEPKPPVTQKRGWFSWLFGSREEEPVSYRHSISNDGESMKLYDDHDPRLPEKPVEGFKKINVFRTNPDQVWDFAPMPEKFGIVDPDDIKAIHYVSKLINS